jgi:hypothetical protein
MQVNALLFDLVFGDAAFCTRREVAPIPLHAALFHQHSGSGCSSGGSAAATSGLKAANGASVCRDSGGGEEVAVGQADAAAAVAEAAIAEAGDQGPCKACSEARPIAIRASGQLSSTSS